jgi:hypothetical protein
VLQHEKEKTFNLREKKILPLFPKHSIEKTSTSRKPVHRSASAPLKPKISIRLVLRAQDDIFWLSYDTLYHTTAKIYHLEPLKLT